MKSLAYSFLYLICILIALIVGLSIWSEWHLSLGRVFGSRQLSFIALHLIVTGSIVGLANLLMVFTSQHNLSWWKEHIRQSFILYITGFAGLIFLPPIIGIGAEGGEIAIRTLIFILFYVAFINALVLFIAEFFNKKLKGKSTPFFTRKFS